LSAIYTAVIGLFNVPECQQRGVFVLQKVKPPFEMSFREHLIEWADGKEVLSCVEYRLNPSRNTLELGTVLKEGLPLLVGGVLTLDNVYWLRDTNGVVQTCTRTETDCGGLWVRLTAKQSDKMWPELPKRNAQLLQSGVTIPVVPDRYYDQRRKRDWGLIKPAKNAHKRKLFVKGKKRAEFNEILYFLNDEFLPNAETVTTPVYRSPPPELVGMHTSTMDVTYDGPIQLLTAMRDLMLCTPMYARSLRWPAFEMLNTVDGVQSALSIEHNGERISIASQVLSVFNYVSPAPPLRACRGGREHSKTVPKG